MKPHKHSIFLTAAYGRRYKTKEQALTAWDSGKDFITTMGSYCSVRDLVLLKTNYNRVFLQYDRGILEI